MTRVVRNTTQKRIALADDWEFVRTDPDQATAPDALARLSLEWRAARLPTTVARTLGILAEAGTDRGDLDESDYWFRTRFQAPAAPWSLGFDGLATLSDVWVDGEHVLSGDNMFVGYDYSAGSQRSRPVELAIRFKSLRAALRKTRKRPRWRTRLVDDPALRGVRTTLFGRMPGWPVLVPAIGPWRKIDVIEHGAVTVRSADVRARAKGAGGVVSARVVVRTSSTVKAATMRVGDATAELSVTPRAPFDASLAGEIELTSVERWWPHTHGSQPLYPVILEIELENQRVELDLGKTGFRTIAVERRDGAFTILVNDLPIFCRGACWLPLDLVALDAPDEALEQTLRLVRNAGMNMLRIAAQGIYERDAFFDRCDELGILVWQDFMFSRMDYPDDPAFLRNVVREASQLLDRTQLRPSLGVLCGNSEVEQQVAMTGLDPDLGRSRLFYRVLPAVCSSSRPDIPYLPSTPSGGAMPFHTDSGVAHYFGVGAYRRPFSDARLSNVRFATECLALSNVPERPAIERLLGREAPGSTPRWKAGIERDAGASWDFEDVREHYLEACFEVDARKLRAGDPERWLELSRVATGVTMAKTIAEFRRAESRCAGALLWHLRDLAPGAGCGLLDALGEPKAAYRFVARAFRPVALFLNDEGLNGLSARMINDSSRSIAAELVVSLYRDGKTPIARVTAPVALLPRSAVELSVEALIGRFVDATYAYRFGPPGHDVAAARLVDVVSGEVLAEDLHFPLGLPSARRSDLTLSASATPHQAGALLSLRSNAVAYAVHVEADGFEPYDDYFHLEPDVPKAVVLVSSPARTGPPRARITALNASSVTTLRLQPERAVESA
jgi:beta-mannosidase